MLAILATINSVAQSNHSDSTTVSNAALRRILIAAEQKKVLDEQVILLNQRISGLQDVIKVMTDKDTATVGSYERQIALMKDQRKVFEDEVARLNKEIKRYKRKLFFRTAGGLILTGTMAYLLLTK